MRTIKYEIVITVILDFENDQDRNGHRFYHLQLKTKNTCF